MPNEPEPKKTLFVICPIGADDSPVRKQSDQLMKFIIKPVADELGYEVERADLIVESGLITAQIFNRLATSPLVLADLTGHNPNVFYELAVRHAVRKPVIHLIAKGQSIPFDVANNRTLFYELELEAVERAKEELRKMIEAAMSEDGPTESPISDALERVQLLESSEPVERRDAELLAMVSDIRARLSMLEVSGRNTPPEEVLFDFESSLNQLTNNILSRTESAETFALLAQLEETSSRLQAHLYSEGRLTSYEASKLRHPTRVSKIRTYLEDSEKDREES